MATFTYLPSYGTNLTRTPRVLKSKFGDGYQQRMQDGINHNPRTWKLVFNGRRQDEMDAIEDFLDARGGVESFDWTPPRGPAGKWICESGLTITTVAGTLTNATCTFEEVFGE
jgi:phage-related protein